MADPGNSLATVVLVHGLWNRGWYLTVMARRLRSRGHKVAVFSYPTRNKSLQGHADDLRDFVLKNRSDEMHLVGHSLGGLVILNMLSRFDDLPPGRVVLIGSPVAGSNVVRRLEKIPGQKLLFGEIREYLLNGFKHTPREHETGMIAGTRSMGLGRITGRHEEPNDGTVTLSETRLEGLADRIELPVSHTEMLVSSDVVEQIEQFLLHGKFSKAG